MGGTCGNVHRRAWGSHEPIREMHSRSRTHRAMRRPISAADAGAISEGLITAQLPAAIGYTYDHIRECIPTCARTRHRRDERVEHKLAVQGLSMGTTYA